jgi:hypothetical protein
LAAAAAAAVGAAVALAAVAVAATAAEAGGSISSISSSSGSSICSGSGRQQQRQQQQWELRWHCLRQQRQQRQRQRQQQRQQRWLPNGWGSRARPGWGRRCAQALPLWLGLCPCGLVFASMPIAMMWGGSGGAGGAGSSMGAKSTMIKGEDIQQSNGHIGQWQQKQIMQTKYGYGRWSMQMILVVGNAIATTGESWKQRK